MGNSLTPQVPYMRYTNESDQQELTCWEVITNWWRWVPLITRFLIYTSTIISLIGIFFPIAYETLMNIPQFVYYSFEIWRIFTAPVANYGIIMLFFGLISYIPISMINENTKGSTKYMLYFITLSIISQIFLTLFDYTLQKLVTFPSISNGLWTMVMIEVTIDAIKEPNATRVFFWFPIPAIYLPFIYLLIFGLINPVWLLGLMWGCFTGLLYGLGLLSCLDPEEGWVNFANAYILFPFLSFSSFAKEFERPGNAPSNNRNESSSADVINFSSYRNESK